MTHRSIVVALWVLAVLAVTACAFYRARNIETDLLLRAQAALIDARIPYHRLTFQGRDAVLGEPNSAAEHPGERIAAVVATVPGVRRVVYSGDGLPAPTAVSHTPTVETAPDTARSPRQPGWLQVFRIGDNVVVDGHLPKGASDRLLARLSELVGPVEASLDTTTPVQPARWLARAADLADLVSEMDGGRLSVFDHTALLVGEIDTLAASIRVQRLAESAFPSLSWGFRLRTGETTGSEGPSTARGTTP